MKTSTGRAPVCLPLRGAVAWRGVKPGRPLRPDDGGGDLWFWCPFPFVDWVRQATPSEARRLFAGLDPPDPLPRMPRPRAPTPRPIGPGACADDPEARRVELAIAANRGDQQARDALIHDLLSDLSLWCRPRAAPPGVESVRVGAEHAELVSEAVGAVLRGLRRYDPARGALTPFALYLVRDALRSFVKRACGDPGSTTKLRRTDALRFDDGSQRPDDGAVDPLRKRINLPPDESDPEQLLQDRQEEQDRRAAERAAGQRWQAVLASRSPRDRAILRALEGDESQSDVAARFQLSKQTISDIWCKATAEARPK